MISAAMCRIEWTGTAACDSIRSTGIAIEGRSERFMLPPYDIFKVDVRGHRWMEAAADLQRAQARVKVLAASSPGEYLILNQETGETISIKPPAKRILFQIGYDEKGLNARAELLRRFGHEVISVTHNEAAKIALSSFRNVDIFIVGHTAPEPTRKEMVMWLKANYPQVK